MKLVLPSMFPEAESALGRIAAGCDHELRVFLPEIEFGFAEAAVVVSLARAAAGESVVVVTTNPGPVRWQCRKLAGRTGGRTELPSVWSWPGGGLLAVASPDALNAIPLKGAALVVCLDADRLAAPPNVGFRRRVAVGRVPARAHWTLATGSRVAVDGIAAARWLGDAPALARVREDETELSQAAFARRWRAIPTEVGEQGAGDLLAWAKRYFPHYLTLPPSELHEEFANTLSSLHLHRGSRVNRVGPRQSAKSTYMSLVYPLYCICEQLEWYILMLSDTTPQAVLNLANVKDELLFNQKLRADYPAATGEGTVWQDSAIETGNGIRIEALGTGKKIRGRRFGQHRPSLILGDDLENEDHIFSQTRRERVRSWFNRAVLKAGNAQTNVVTGGTVLHRECLVFSLHSTPGWDSKVFASIVQWPKHMELWAQWEGVLNNPAIDTKVALKQAKKYYEEHREKMNEGAVVLWPESEPLYSLMLMRAIEGRQAFNTEKQSVPSNPEANEWSDELFGEWMWFDNWPKNLEVKVVSLDPSKGKDAKRGDFSAIIKLGVDKHGVLWVDADLQRRDTSQICEDFIQACYNFEPDRAAVETNQFQELLEPDIITEADKIGYTVPLAPVVNTVSKNVRVRRLTPFLTQKKIRFRRASAGCRLCVSQMQDFPNGDHDDGPDALEVAIRVASAVWNGATNGDGGVQAAFEANG